MLITESLLVVCALLIPQKDARVEISPTAAAGKVAKAIKAGPGPAMEAIKSHGKIADPVVTKAVGKALRSRDVDIRMAAIKALRFNEDASAVSELLKVCKNKNVVESVVVGPEYFLALGQHGDLKAFPVLAASFKSARRRDPVLQARVLAIGRMRSRSSIDILVRNRLLLVRLRASGEARMSLAALSGRDPGKDWRAWGEWWEEVRRGFKIAPKEKALPVALAKRWDRVWSDSVPGAAKKPRKRAGGDPPTDDDGSGSDADGRKNKRRTRQEAKKKGQ